MSQVNCDTAVFSFIDTCFMHLLLDECCLCLTQWQVSFLTNGKTQSRSQSIRYSRSHWKTWLFSAAKLGIRNVPWHSINPQLNLEHSGNPNILHGNKAWCHIVVLMFLLSALVKGPAMLLYERCSVSPASLPPAESLIATYSTSFSSHSWLLCLGTGYSNLFLILWLWNRFLFMEIMLVYLALGLFQATEHWGKHDDSYGRSSGKFWPSSYALH